ncbi:MAG TPA: HAD family phosphatase [Patescibacteria group bacterium]|nr:HAD family phosphatase [Patescibacteria group bacterium]
MKFAAVILDLDGTIIESEEEWGKAFITVMQKLGVNVVSDPHTVGTSIESNWREILLKHSIKTNKTLQELELLSYDEYEKLIPLITLNDGVLEFMDTLKENGTPLGLATSTNWQTADKILKHFGLDDYFESITTGEEAVNQKPAPDIYLIAADKFGIAPEDCLVVEDSLAGVTAAHEAGMKVIAVTQDENIDKLYIADLVVEGFSEITLKAIDAIGED